MGTKSRFDKSNGSECSIGSRPTRAQTRLSRLWRAQGFLLAPAGSNPSRKHYKRRRASDIPLQGGRQAQDYRRIGTRIRFVHKVMRGRRKGEVTSRARPVLTCGWRKRRAAKSADEVRPGPESAKLALLLATSARRLRPAATRKVCSAVRLIGRLRRVALVADQATHKNAAGSG